MLWKTWISRNSLGQICALRLTRRSYSSLTANKKKALQSLLRTLLILTPLLQSNSLLKLQGKANNGVTSSVHIRGDREHRRKLVKTDLRLNLNSYPEPSNSALTFVERRFTDLRAKTQAPLLLLHSPVTFFSHLAVKSFF